MIVSKIVLLNRAKLVHLLWALAFLKLYCAEAVLAALVGGVHEQTFRKWAWFFVEEISTLQYTVICWANRFQGMLAIFVWFLLMVQTFRFTNGNPFGKDGSPTNLKGC